MIAETLVATGGGLVENLLHLLIIAICLGIVWALGVWAFTAFGAGPMARKVWDGIFIFVIAIALINFLLGLGGHAFIAW